MQTVHEKHWAIVKMAKHEERASIVCLRESVCKMRFEPAASKRVTKVINKTVDVMRGGYCNGFVCPAGDEIWFILL